MSPFVEAVFADDRGEQLPELVGCRRGEDIRVVAQGLRLGGLSGCRG